MKKKMTEDDLMIREKTLDLMDYLNELIKDEKKEEKIVKCLNILVCAIHCMCLMVPPEKRKSLANQASQHLNQLIEINLGLKL